MKVYIIEWQTTNDLFGDSPVQSVYSTYEAAEQAVEKLITIEDINADLEEIVQNRNGTKKYYFLNHGIITITEYYVHTKEE